MRVCVYVCGRNGIMGSLCRAFHEGDMGGTTYRVLNDEQVESFLTKGYLLVKDCFDRELAREWTSRAWERLGYDPDDPTTWEKEFIWMHPAHRAPIRDVSPKAWDAFCDVLGGEERIDTRTMTVEGHYDAVNATTWADAFIVNFTKGADLPWEPPSADVEGWHKDGGYFRHFLTSREEALLTVLYWTDVAHQGGGTFIAPDSVKHVARYLAEHPEGVKGGVPAKEIIHQCSEFVEVTGEVGDLYICHPFMLHASSRNVRRVPRFMTNLPMVLKEPMDLNRPDPADFSLLERATLRALGVERYDFQPTAPAESYWTVVDEVET